METAPEKVIAALLTETKAAHGAYQTNVLGGVLDEAWRTWYAAYRLTYSTTVWAIISAAPRVLTSPIWPPCWRGSPRTTSEGTRSVPVRMCTHVGSSRDSPAVLWAKNLLPWFRRRSNSLNSSNSSPRSSNFRVGGLCK